MPESWIFDPTSEATGTQLDVSVAPYRVTVFSSPAPPLETATSGSIDTEGDAINARRHQNRQVSLTVEVTGTSQTNLDSNVATLEAKVAKLAREGGTFRRVRTDGAFRTLDILAADSYEKSFDVTYFVGNMAVCQISLLAEPYARAAEVTLSSHAEATLPALVFTETGIAGDVPATGRLVVTEAQAQDQAWAVWGLQSRYYDSAATAALFYEAEGRTALSGAASTVVAGSSGGSVVRYTSIGASLTPILSTQATAGGAHLTHVGLFRVYASVTPTISAQNNVGLTVQMQWGVGDLRSFTSNTAVVLPFTASGTRRLVDLGLVRIPQVQVGTQRWEGRVLVSSGTTDSIDVDYLMLVPVSEGSATITAASLQGSSAIQAYTARDSFNQTAGALTGKTLETGGAWAGAGSVTDFAVDATSHYATRATAVSETFPGGGRIGLAGLSTVTDAVIDVDVGATAAFPAGVRLGIVARYVDASNYLLAIGTPDGAGRVTMTVVKVIAGTATTIGGSAQTTFTLASLSAHFDLSVFRNGSFVFSSGGMRVTGQDAALATGGTLASGRVGIYDINTTANASTRTFDSFAAYVPALDAAVFASRQLQFRSDGVLRQDSTGTIWSPVTPEGDNLLIPVAGNEGRTSRILVKLSRTDPEVGADAGIDDLSAQLFYTPRYLSVT